MPQRIVIGNEVYRQAMEPYSSPHPSTVQKTEDEYGKLYVIPTAEFTGDIHDDILRLSASHSDMEAWLYGELESEASITDEVGDVVYAGADVQDVLRALDQYEEDPGESGIEIGPGAQVAPGWILGTAVEDDDSFTYDVGDLDDLVVTALMDEVVEGGDMHVTVDIRSADDVQGDLMEIEDVLNNASLVTTVGGIYSLETEGVDAVVAFSADSRDVDKLVPAFLEE